MSINGDPKPEKPESKDKVGESFTLPNKDEMLARLIAVNDNSHLQQKFYPRLLKDAGTVKVPMGVVMMLTLAVHDYTAEMPPMMAGILSMRLPDFIDALIPVSKAAEEAKKLWKEANG
jgi:hypothetical protein